MTTEPTPPTPTPSSDRDSEIKYCDLVMKGGITSGVVYPRAIVELAKTYRFKNIGGTSAGAIAAAVAAAAEHGRDVGGFEKLAAVSGDLSNKLLGLFQPAKPFRPLFNAFLGILNHKNRCARVLAVLGALIRGYTGWVLLGLLPGLVMVGVVVTTAASPSFWVLTGFVLLLGLCVALVGRILWSLLKDLPRHKYGICPGIGGTVDKPALTEWLTANINDMAGLDPQGDPLTFGQLRGQGDEPDINLVIMTTNLTAGRPHRIPLNTRIFMYSEAEFAGLFPERVCQWLHDHSQAVPNNSAAADDLRRLPLTPDLPVVVAVRMSLSFPVLLAAVPLWACDYTLLERAEKDTPRRCWFSDGGISSNFPIHFFDSIWPRWPTFGITLEKFDEQRHQPDEKAWLPNHSGKGILREFTPITSTVGFLKSIVDTMQNWHDNMQTILPGYRERVVRIRLSEEEGGLHLSMAPELIEQLTRRGYDAGVALAADFDPEAHRWRRWLVSMERLEDLMDQAIAASGPREGAGEGYKTFIRRYGRDPGEYKQSAVWLDRMNSNAGAFADLAEVWVLERSVRGGEFPRPETEVRISPKV
ncbi:MAG: hypothetical protein GY838_17215 [bacterium]|nr:hypothetical protein [bacterium]